MDRHLEVSSVLVALVEVTWGMLGLTNSNMDCCLCGEGVAASAGGGGAMGGAT